MIASARGLDTGNVVVDDLTDGDVGVIQITPSGYRYLVSDQIAPHVIKRVVAHLGEHLSEARAVAGVLAVCDRENCPAASAWLPAVVCAAEAG